MHFSSLALKFLNMISGCVTCMMANPSRFIGLGSEAHWSDSVQVPALWCPPQCELRLSIRLVGKLLGHAVWATHLEVVNAFRNKNCKDMIFIELILLCHIRSCLGESEVTHTWSGEPVTGPEA